MKFGMMVKQEYYNPSPGYPHGNRVSRGVMVGNSSDCEFRVKATLKTVEALTHIESVEAQCSQELWFQQDGATCHTARATIDLLKDTFGDRLISRFGPMNWPPRSCDLTPLDYFLWGYVQSLVYEDKP
ncbi:uncharacterized protein TNCV_2871701 [Trichonephila clavipes]|nr:uncharacterized protein TNCV_2871701 [Trichonephila clavipes]